MTETQKQHHYFGPSSLERRILCPGSYRIESAIDSSTLPASEAAERGTRIHAAIAYNLAKENASILNSNQEELEKVELLEGEEQFVERALDFIAGEIATMNAPQMYIEQKLEYKDFTGTVFFGRCDLLIIEAGEIGHLYDFKTGFLAVDDAADNSQGAAYALAAMQQYMLAEVRVTFYNPCIGQNTTAAFDDAEALAAFISRAIDACKKDDAACVTGAKQCKYCAGALTGTCPHWIATHNSAVALIEGGNRLPYTQMADETLAAIYEKCKLVDKLENGIENEIKARATLNGSCAGWKIKEQSAGREATNVPEIYQAALRYMTDGEIQACMTFSLAKVKAAWAKKAKISGDYPTETEAKMAFDVLTADSVSDKPTRKCLVK